MFTKFEHFAATSLMGSPQEAPPRQDGHLQFDRDWEKLAFGVAIALSKQGHYEWEEFRQTLIATIDEWESTHELDDPEWDYYQCWLSALEKIAIASGVLEAGELEQQLAQVLDCKAST
ncbi:nitrile hydratase accessory protein [cf. Phormidesmis sp. LEGE 11477]|uniref:nitrile hydratase accessory protein n=1 Tax=cf. Phormidesmis sp. LEGE 11477 TaxID=1828680 RepID=UPI00187DFC4F|nr:nitrile hydratase accessory protein [cf. Phormidesmis sp. LEGE 11477]MBE9061373.1 nitrile hydratase accessory protein [cf. Phormidesmis sp. LEGE 11477]